MTLPYPILSRRESEDRIVYIVKYVDKNVEEYKKALEAALNKKVDIYTYTRHHFIYADYDKQTKTYLVHSQYALDRMKHKTTKLVEPQFNTEPLSALNGEIATIRGYVAAVNTDVFVLVTDSNILPVLCLATDIPKLNSCVEVSGHYDAKKKRFVATAIKQAKMTDTPRVELHALSNNSELSSILKLEDYVSHAASRGYTALTLTDYMAVHAYPEFEKLCNAASIKPIYGCEILIGETSQPPIMNLKDNISDIYNAKYAFVDIEATGLNTFTDEIIEITIKVMDKMQEVETFTTLVKPTKKLSQTVTNITGITDSMLKDAPTAQEIKQRVLKLLDGCVIVAHNAEFDYEMLTKTFGKIDTPVFDTLKFARLLLPKKKRFSLQSLASHFKIKPVQKHRSEADVETLKSVFLKLLKLATDRGLDTFQKINTAFSKEIENYNEHILTVLVKNQTGLRNLYRMLTDAYTVYLNRVPIIPKSKLEEYHDGLLYGTGLVNSELYNAIKTEQLDRIDELMRLYDYIEICPVDATDEPEIALEVFRKMLAIAKNYNKPAVIVSNATYLIPAYKVCYDAFMKSKRIRKETNANRHFRVSDELYKAAYEITQDEELSKQLVFSNPAKLAELVEQVKIAPERFITPGIEDAENKLFELAKANLHKLYGENPHPVVLQRFETEWEIIRKYKYSELYWIAKLAVAKSQELGYIVGSRGSVGSSLIAFLIGITEVNPLAPHYLCNECHYTEFVDGAAEVGYDLEAKRCPNCGRKLLRIGCSIPFETFVGLKGERTPDIDLNFADDIQRQIHQYISQLFGTESVIRAGTVLRIATKTAAAIAGDYLNQNKSVSPIWKEVIMQQLEDAKSGTGQHPGGLLIFNKSTRITDYTPIQYPANDPNEPRISHIEYDYLHDHVMKLDALGHLNPAILKLLYELTKVDPFEIDMCDPNVLALFRDYSTLKVKLDPVTKVGTIGIPEFGTKFVRKILEVTKPTTFEELIKIAGLAHGTNVWNDNAEYYIKAKIATLQQVIASRDDIYRTLSKVGVDPNVSFEIMERIKKGKGLEEKHVKLLKDKVPQWYIESMNKIKYLFPRAHAAAYTIMSYRIAWYKLYYPLQFYAAVLTKKNQVTYEYYQEDTQNLERLILLATPEEFSMPELMCLEIAYECKKRGFDFLPPHVCISHPFEFTIENGKIRLPLDTIKGIGKQVALSIYQARQECQFSSIDDFAKRAKVNQNVLETLKHAGALNGL